MSMNLAGGFAAGAGADALEDILRRQFAEALARQQQQLAEQARRDNLQYRQDTLDSLNGQRQFAQQQATTAAAAKADQASTAGNQAQLRAAIQGSQNLAGSSDPNGALATRNALRVALASGGAKANEIPQEPKPEAPKLYAVTVRGPNGQPIRKMVTGEQLAQGVEEYRAPEKPDKPGAPQIYYDAGGAPHALQFVNGAFGEVSLPPGIAGRTAPKPAPATPKTPEQIEAESRARAAGTAKGKKDAVGGGLLSALGNVFASHEVAPTAVRMKTPDGRVVNIPAEQVAEAKRRGAVEIR